MRLTFAEVCVDAHVTCSARQTLVLAVRNVFVGHSVDVLLRESKVNHVNDVPTLRRLAANEKILRLDVAVD